MRTNSAYIKAHLGLSSLVIDVVRPDPNRLLDWLNKNRPLQKATVLVSYTLINQMKPRESMLIYQSNDSQSQQEAAADFLQSQGFFSLSELEDDDNFLMMRSYDTVQDFMN